jgi:hypothetical protein
MTASVFEEVVRILVEVVEGGSEEHRNRLEDRTLEKVLAAMVVVLHSQLTVVEVLQVELRNQ